MITFYTNDSTKKCVYNLLQNFNLIDLTKDEFAKSQWQKDFIVVKYFKFLFISIQILIKVI